MNNRYRMYRMRKKKMAILSLIMLALLIFVPLATAQNSNYYIPQWQNNNNYITQTNNSYYIVVMPYTNDYIYVNIPTGDWLYMNDVNALGGNMTMSIQNANGTDIMTFGFPNAVPNEITNFTSAIQIAVFMNSGNTTVVINGYAYTVNNIGSSLVFSGNGSFFYKSIYIYYPSSSFALANDYAYVLFAFIFVFIFIAIVIALIKFSRGEE